MLSTPLLGSIYTISKKTLPVRNFIFIKMVSLIWMFICSILVSVAFSSVVPQAKIVGIKLICKVAAPSQEKILQLMELQPNISIQIYSFPLSPFHQSFRR